MLARWGMGKISEFFFFPVLALLEWFLGLFTVFSGSPCCSSSRAPSSWARVSAPLGPGQEMMCGDEI